MSYLPDTSRAGVDVSTHYFSGRSGDYFTYNTPSRLGLGVTRPDSVSFTLASGRSYLLIGSVNLIQNSTFDWLEQDFQFEKGGVVSGKKAKAVICKFITERLLRHTPMYRSEAVIFIPSSSISTSVTVKLKVVATTSNGGTTLTYSQNTSYPAAVQILSVRD